MATITSWKFMFTCNITQNKDKWTSDVMSLFVFAAKTHYYPNQMYVTFTCLY